MKYKIIVDSIVETEYPETDTRYVNTTTQEPCEYGDKGAVRQIYQTGKKLRRSDIDTVYEQTVDDINLENIIKAVNNII